MWLVEFPPKPQGTADPNDMAPVTAIILFAQMISAALGVAAAQAAFVNQLIHMLSTSAPDVNPADVVATGATDIRFLGNFKRLHTDDLKGAVAATQKSSCRLPPQDSGLNDRRHS
ncbi:hypothetical protein DL770_004006 [Monosporascus sp. CRB-9-2]|nr:hypothetical protein DL770_004006 [Monosporascus sp. CRB-9-2]